VTNSNLKTDKFRDIPVEEDTRMIFQHEAKLGEYDVLYQMWTWDGVTAESIIFTNEDVAGLSEETIKAEVKTSPLVEKDSQLTFTHSESGFTFVNFNFRTE
jgi:hypothetical protein